jgi:UDP-N-acetylglucosamine 2-epimerase (non-hydrolysing)
MVLVHGDTAATLSASLAAFYHKIPVGHVEAGLRSHNKLSPWPEVVNRRATDVIADLLFAPTRVGRENLLREGCDPERIFVTGQTAVDTAMLPRHETHRFKDAALKRLEAHKGRIIAVTAHRRENYGRPFENMFTAIRRLADEFPDVLVVYPVHLSPVVREAASRVLGGHERILLLEPADYMDMIRLLRLSYMVMSDSGGLQEETAVFGKPMVQMRDTTERPEGVEAGSVYLSGVEEEAIYAIGRRLLTDKEYYAKMASARNPFGDGRASHRIVRIIMRYFGMAEVLPDEFC